MRHPRSPITGALAFVAMVLVVLTAFGCTAPMVDPGAPLDRFTAQLDARVPSLMDRFDVPGATLALVRDSVVVWSGAYGYADRERNRPMTVDAVFRAESISKPVTAWGVMRLVEQGQIDLDAPAARYLDGFALPDADDAARPITVRHLLSNSAGLPLGPVGPDAEYAPGQPMPSLQDYLAQSACRVQAPGAGFIYSNVGFNTLELLVEEVTGRDFAAYIADEVLRPLGMARARFGGTEPLRAAMPLGYEMDGTPVPPYVYPARAAGGLLATVEDIARFVRAEVAGPDAQAPVATTDVDTADRAVLAPERIRLLHEPQVEIGGLFGAVADAYGLGHFIETLPGGQRAVWHGGQGHGWMTHFHAVPATGDGIVILTNSERSWPLMARVLRDWSQWSGGGAVQFSRIVHATTALWGLIGLIALTALGQAIRLGRGWWRGRRRWAPFARTARLARSLQAAAAVGVIAALAWSLAQPYLFVTSIFPIAAPWAGITLLVGALVLALSAVLPRRAS